MSVCFSSVLSGCYVVVCYVVCDTSGTWRAGCVSFFFQAEDGIRDLVRSRGLGDVYKRQRLRRTDIDRAPRADHVGYAESAVCRRRKVHRADIQPVSYTHLTLPTSDLV